MHPYVERITAVGAQANPTFQKLGIRPVSWGNGEARFADDRYLESA